MLYPTINLIIELRILILASIMAAGLIIPASAELHPVFSESFDVVPNGWLQSSCMLNNDRANQSCFLRTASSFPISSSPTLGIIGVQDIKSNAGYGGTGAKYEKSFNVTSSGLYNVSSIIHSKDCGGCNIYSRLYIDDILIFEKRGDNRYIHVSAVPTLESNMTRLDPGIHKVTIENFNTDTHFGTFISYFDDIKIIPVSIDEPIIIDEAQSRLDKKLARYNTTLFRINDTISDIEILEQQLKTKQAKLAHLESLLDQLYLQILNLAPDGYVFPFKD